MLARVFRKQILPWIGFPIACVLLAGCTRAEESQVPEGEMSIQVTSPAFAEGGSLPKRHTCDGKDLSPALAWSEAPAGTQSLALIADDPDAPVGTFVHWVLFDIPAGLTELPEGAAGVGVQGTNGFRKTGYGGPCPPRGSTHRYFFKIYALDTTLNLKEGATKADVEKAMKGHVVGQGQLVGKYGR